MPSTSSSKPLHTGTRPAHPSPCLRRRPASLGYRHSATQSMHIGVMDH